MFNRLSAIKAQLFNQWLTKRIPASKQITFNLRNVFILPSAFGGALLAIIFAIYILGTNYANNLVMLLCYWLTAMMIVAMHWSFNNFYGLSLTVTHKSDVFMGEPLTVDFKSSSQKKHMGLSMQHELGKAFWPIVHSLEHTQIELWPQHRGQLRLTRFRLQSKAPFGLFNVWSLIDFDQQILVYAKPIACPQYLLGTGQLADTFADKSQLTTSFADDFVGLKDYLPGESLKKIAWKQVAQGRGLQSKDFAHNADDSHLCFSYPLLARQGHELAISQLTWLILQMREKHQRFSLELPNHVLGPDDSNDFIAECLTALALLPDFAIKEGK